MSKPAFRVECNGNDLTTFIQQRLLSLRILDEAGFKNDRMELTIDNRDQAVAIPEKGSEFTVYMGYDDLRQMGTYKMDEATLFGKPDSMTITAHAADTNSTFKATQNRSWHGQTIEQIVSTIAGNNGLTSQISSDLASTQIDHVDQTHQSDMGFLTDLARNNNAIMKVANGQVYFAPRDQAKSMSGENVQSVTIAYSETIRYNYITQGRSNYTGARAVYQDKDTGKEMYAGAGDATTGPKTGNEVWGSQAEAQSAANETYATLQRTQETLELNIPGNPDVMSESPITIDGFPSSIPTDWLADRVQHQIDGKGAYVTSLVCVTPGSSSGSTSGGGGSGQEEPQDNKDSGNDGYNVTEQV